MLPLILLAAGAYIIGEAVFEDDKYAEGGMMAKGGFNPMKNSYLIYEGQSILLKTVPSPKERRFLDKEIVIEKIDNNKIIKAFVRETGEKVPFFIDSNLFKIEQYGDGGMMAKGGKTPVVRTQFEEEEFEYAKGGVVGKYELMPYVSMGQMRSGKMSQLSTPSFKDKVIFEGSKDEAIMKANNMVDNSDEFLLVEVSYLNPKATNAFNRTKKIEMVRKSKMAQGGHTQGYDDREDERLAMQRGKIAKKDLKSTHARRDDARFEERGK